MSSSPREASEFNAILVVDQGVASPIMLPMKKQQAFIAEFNATYGRIGLKIQRIPNQSERDSREAETPCGLEEGRTQ